MRVLHLLESLGVYGKERVILELAEAQKRAGHAPIIGGLTRWRQPDAQPLLVEAGRRNLETMPLTLRSLSDPFRIDRALRNSGVELVHAHDYKSSLLLAPFRRVGRLPPLVRTLHGYTTVTRFSRMHLYEQLDRWCLRWHDAVVTVTPSMRQPTPRVQAVVIENGITAPAAVVNRAADPDLDAAPAFCRNDLVLGALSRLAPEKNLQALIVALAALHQSDISARLIVVGEGRCRAMLEAEAIRLGVGDRVWLPGFKPDVQPWLALFNLYLQPSWTEGLPIALLEAMYAEVPLLVTPVGGMKGILAAGAAVELPFTGTDIARLVRDLHTSPGGRAKIQATTVRARAVVRERYSSHAMAQRYESLYRRILTNDRPPLRGRS